MEFNDKVLEEVHKRWTKNNNTFTREDEQDFLIEAMHLFKRYAQKKFADSLVCEPVA